MQYVDTETIEFKWTAPEGDFDSYRVVYYDANQAKVGDEDIDKSKISFQYTPGDSGVKFYSLHTVKDGTQSTAADIEPVTATFEGES